ncbi:hypothetical protein ACFVWP_19200 [Streptomyces sp. NPDC058175]|uniref:hypothetical protein n=1 Tax=Streptomyces sp. NPDC058175 TaxID=3346367 RepID=UPI0036E92DDA
MAPHCAAGTDSVVVVLIGRRSRSRAPRHRARRTVGAVAPLGMVGALGTVGVVETVGTVGVVKTVGTVGVVETAGTGTVVVETIGTGTVVAGVARTPEAARSPQCAARTDSLVVLIRRQPRSRVPRHGAVGTVGAVGPLGAVGTGSVVASDGCGTGRRLSRTAEVTRTTPVITARRTTQHHKPPTADTTRNTQVITARCAIRQHKPPTAEVTRRALLLISAAPSGSRGS